MKCVEFEETKHSASKKDKENHERMLPQRGGGGDALSFPSYMINDRAKQNSGA